WFLKNPYSDDYWFSFVSANKNISNDLILDLYEANQQHFHLNWNPLMTNGAFLSEEYFEVGARGSGEYCLVEGESPIGVRDSISGLTTRYQG
ncbi:MAG: hypothetical protein AAF446_07430, partial [Pseudomonadota bacterium]